MTKKHATEVAFDAGCNLFINSLAVGAYREFDGHIFPARGTEFHRITLGLREGASRDHVEAMIKAHLPGSFARPELICIGFTGRGADRSVVLMFVQGEVTPGNVAAARSAMQNIDTRACVFYPRTVQQSIPVESDESYEASAVLFASRAQ